MAYEKSNYNFVWWQGFVEDVNDPLKLGRCRVRIVGYHTESKADIPTEHLPWAIVLQPTTSASTSGIGHSPSGLLPGSWVVGFFKDGIEAQQPIIMGSFHGLNQIQEGEKLRDTQFGFNDPNDKYPSDAYKNESDVNKLARNEDVESTIVKKKKDGVDKGNPTALGGNWSEPETPYKATYPKNKVVQTESGHIFEVDDTPNAERIHNYHKSGTFEEIHPDGSRVQKIIGEDFLIVKKNNNVSVYGNLNVNVGNALKVYAGKSMDIQVNGNVRIHVSGNTTLQTDGNFTSFSKGSCNLISMSSMSLIAPTIDLNPVGVDPSSGNPGFNMNVSASPVEVQFAGIPEVPEIPELPNLPNLPEIPNLPTLPDIPQNIDLSGFPDISIPTLPSLENISIPNLSNLQIPNLSEFSLPELQNIEIPNIDLGELSDRTQLPNVEFPNISDISSNIDVPNFQDKIQDWPSNFA
jgi:hypothetical protein